MLFENVVKMQILAVMFTDQPNVIDAMKRSTHIRVLVFSAAKISHVTATIDSEFEFNFKRAPLDEVGKKKAFRKETGGEEME